MENFWHGKRVLVSGGHGFLGRHLAATLRSCGAEVKTPTRRQTDWLYLTQVIPTLRELQPDLIFHLAATVGGIGVTAAQPATCIYDNLQMGLNVAEAARLVGKAKVVMASSVCAYPQFSPIPIQEGDLWNGYPEPTNGPYGIAKRTMQTVLDAYHRQHDLKSVYLLLANLYGPGDDYNLETAHVIPALIRRFHEAKLREDKTVTLWGNGSATRDFLYVTDAVRALIIAAQKLDAPIPINIGTGIEWSIRDLAYGIQDQIGYTGSIQWDEARPNGQPRRRLDIQRAWQILGWQPQVTFSVGLVQAIQDYFSRLEVGRL